MNSPALITTEYMDMQNPLAIVLAGESDSGPPSSIPAISKPEKPVKKPTRQWAAWTRQEEESFFCALRQVGKNFEKITSRVQSKNKDQVRHYYYRLVRRMNKLLGPGFGLDARNSKDTIAAMLRWWSLLEKHSCTASKLHLKPRRFKTFVEALAHQLLKDRNKTRKKRLQHGENFAAIPENGVSILHSPNEYQPGNGFHITVPITPKAGSAKSASMKGLSLSENCSKGGPITEKITKPRRRTGLVASAAYKRWEKAAIAGVSLVADAAEKLELLNNGVNAFDQSTSIKQPRRPYPSKNRDNVSFAENGKDATCKNFVEKCSHQAMDTFQKNQTVDTQPVTKLKLQLFPIDECTRKALEKDRHNPYLELTLSSRKRISSILEHLHRKWGNSSIASGEIALLPYTIYPDLVSCQRWTQCDKSACAGDLYVSVGSPAIFRLRYGWLGDGESGHEKLLSTASIPSNDCKITLDGVSEMSVETTSCGEALTNGVNLQETSPCVLESVFVPSEECITPEPVVDVSNNGKGLLTDSWDHGPTDGTNIKEHAPEELRLGVGQAGDWTDSLISVSVGELLSEIPKAAPVCNGPDGNGPINPSFSQAPFSCDSFDAAIAAHVTGHTELGNACIRVPQSSFWDADEACDGFSFGVEPLRERAQAPDLSSLVASRDGCHGDDIGFHRLLKSNDAEPLDHLIAKAEAEEDPRLDVGSSFEKPESDRNVGLADIYWPDSLGALDLDIPPTRYIADDIFFGESISIGLSRLMTSSLDAFQNCSMLGFSLDKREQSK